MHRVSFRLQGSRVSGDEIDKNTGVKVASMVKLEGFKNRENVGYQRSLLRADRNRGITGNAKGVVSRAR